MLPDEVEPRIGNRSVRPAARPAASRPRVLVAPDEALSPGVKATVTKSASCGKLGLLSSEADFVTTPLLFTESDIQDREEAGRSDLNAFQTSP